MRQRKSPVKKRRSPRLRARKSSPRALRGGALACVSGKSVAECLLPIRDLMLTRTHPNPTDIELRFDNVALLAGGKSGAFVWKVRDKSSRETAVLKYYPRIASDIHDDRPFREVATLCSLSHVDGFPCVFEYGAAKRPSVSAWGVPPALAPLGLFVVMSTAQGKALSDLDISKLSPASTVAIAWRLLGLLHSAKQALGGRFEHFDLHPDNIFVDTEHCMAPTRIALPGGGSEVVTCPTVSLIDFDLASSADFDKAINAANIPLKEHVFKRVSTTRVPERTLQFLLKTVGAARSLQLVTHVASLVNTDMRNWVAIVSALLIAGDTSAIPLAPCDSVEECVLKNSVALRTASGEVAKREETAGDLSERARQQLILFGGNLILGLWDNTYVPAVRRSRGSVPVGLDTTAFRVQARLDASDLVVSLGVIADVHVPPTIEILVQTRALKPRITISFMGTTNSGRAGWREPGLLVALKKGSLTTISGFLEIVSVLTNLLSGAKDKIARAQRNAYEPSFSRSSGTTGTPLAAIRLVDVQIVDDMPGGLLALDVTVVCAATFGWLPTLAALVNTVSFVKSPLPPGMTLEIQEHAIVLSMRIPIPDTPNPCQKLEKLVATATASAPEIAAARRACRSYNSDMFEMIMTLIKPLVAFGAEGTVAVSPMCTFVFLGDDETAKKAFRAPAESVLSTIRNAVAANGAAIDMNIAVGAYTEDVRQRCAVAITESARLLDLARAIPGAMNAAFTMESLWSSPFEHLMTLLLPEHERQLVIAAKKVLETRFAT